MITTVHKKLNQIGVCNEDERGKYLNRPNTIPDASVQKVRDHINSFETVESHYCRRNSKMLYLPAGLSLPKMYSLYVQLYSLEAAEPVKLSFYRFIFNTEFNLSFHRPKKDQCDICQTFENSLPEEKETLKFQYEKHVINKSKAREHKEADKKR
jgi:predicted aldo/keto reductase-like oxidoreductase